jgi:hypothetical protein
MNLRRSSRAQAKAAADVPVVEVAPPKPVQPVTRPTTLLRKLANWLRLAKKEVETH